MIALSDSRSYPSARKKWITVAILSFLALPAVFLFLLLTSRPPAKNPGVILGFSAFTNIADRRTALFTITNSSQLQVHLLTHSIEGVLLARPFVETFQPHQSAIIHVTPTDFVAPVTVQFNFRRQDTPIEEAREMLDSLLQSLGLSIFGLNPDSRQNEFEVTSTLPKDSADP